MNKKVALVHAIVIIHQDAEYLAVDTWSEERHMAVHKGVVSRNRAEYKLGPRNPKYRSSNDRGGNRSNQLCSPPDPSIEEPLRASIWRGSSSVAIVRTIRISCRGHFDNGAAALLLHGLASHRKLPRDQDCFSTRLLSRAALTKKAARPNNNRRAHQIETRSESSTDEAPAGNLRELVTVKGQPRVRSEARPF